MHQREYWSDDLIQFPLHIIYLTGGTSTCLLNQIIISYRGNRAISSPLASRDFVLAIAVSIYIVVKLILVYYLDRRK
jgi:hypothetical protein